MLVAIVEVIYLKAELKYITIRTADREFLLEESLTRLEEEFGQRFVRVHRNCLVAREAIRGFERRVSADGDAHWEVLLRGSRKHCRSRAPTIHRARNRPRVVGLSRRIAIELAAGPGANASWRSWFRLPVPQPFPSTLRWPHAR